MYDQSTGGKKPTVTKVITKELVKTIVKHETP